MKYMGNLNVENLISEASGFGAALGIIGLLIALGVFALVGFYGYKIQKLFIGLGCGAAVFIFGVKFGLRFVEDPTFVYTIVSIIALLVTILVYSFYIKLISFAVGIVGGAACFFLFGDALAQKAIEIFDVTFAHADLIIKIIFVVLSAVLCGLLAKFFFKWVVIILTGISGGAGMTTCFLLLITSIFNVPTITILFILLAIPLAVMCIIYQFKNNAHSN